MIGIALDLGNGAVGKAYLLHACLLRVGLRAEDTRRKEELGSVGHDPTRMVQECKQPQDWHRKADGDNVAPLGTIETAPESLSPGLGCLVEGLCHLRRAECRCACDLDPKHAAGKEHDRVGTGGHPEALGRIGAIRAVLEGPRAQLPRGAVDGDLESLLRQDHETCLGDDAKQGQKG